jgi:Flp pilus assembly pilin Flp
MKGRKREQGSTLVEYALLAVIVSVTAIVAMKFCEQAVSERFTAVLMFVDFT